MIRPVLTTSSHRREPSTVEIGGAALPAIGECLAEVISRRFRTASFGRGHYPSAIDAEAVVPEAPVVGEGVRVGFADHLHEFAYERVVGKCGSAADRFLPFSAVPSGQNRHDGPGGKLLRKKPEGEIDRDAVSVEKSGAACVRIGEMNPSALRQVEGLAPFSLNKAPPGAADIAPYSATASAINGCLWRQ